MGSGLIFVVIILMWSAYFIPLWLRRHEEKAEARSADRFSHAMRVLSRNRPGIEEKADEAAAPQPAATPPVGRGQAGTSRRPGPGSRSLTFRRRRILAGLLLLTVVLALLTPVTPITWPVALGALVCTLGYLVHLRLQARRRREVSRTRESVRRRTVARLRRFDAAERIFQARRMLREERAAAEQARYEAEVAAQAAARRAADGWEPVPVPLPTYVTKPVAPPPPAPVRDPFDQAVLPPAEPEGDPMEQRRAVND